MIDVFCIENLKEKGAIYNMNVEKNVVKNEVINDLKRGVRFRHRIVIDIFGELFYYSYRKGMSDCFKYYNK